MAFWLKPHFTRMKQLADKTDKRMPVLVGSHKMRIVGVLSDNMFDAALGHCCENLARPVS